MSECPYCGAGSSQLPPVWRTHSAMGSGQQPRYYACENCHQIHDPRLTRGPGEDTPPQAPLSGSEIRRLPIGNQNTPDRLTLIEYQAVKGAAQHYGVADWMAVVDPTLSCEENVSLMEQAGHKNKTTSMREMRTP